MWQLRFVGSGLGAEFWMNGFSFVELEKLFCMNRGDWGCDLNEWRRSRCCLLLVLLHGRKNIWKLERDGYVYVPVSIKSNDWILIHFLDYLVFVLIIWTLYLVPLRLGYFLWQCNCYLFRRKGCWFYLLNFSTHPRVSYHL